MPTVLDSTNALITLSTVQAYAGGTAAEDNDTERLINGASVMLNTLTNRKLLSRTLTEYYNGDGSNVILLRQRPCTSVTTLHDDTLREWGSTTLVDSDDYTIIEDEGKIYATGTSFSTGVKVLKVVYAGGFTAIPADLQTACLELVIYWQNKYFKQKVGIKSVSNEGRNVVYLDDIPQVVHAVADGYRKYWVG